MPVAWSALSLLPATPTVHSIAHSFHSQVPTLSTFTFYSCFPSIHTQKFA